MRPDYELMEVVPQVWEHRVTPPQYTYKLGDFLSLLPPVSFQSFEFKRAPEENIQAALHYTRDKYQPARSSFSSGLAQYSVSNPRIDLHYRWGMMVSTPRDLIKPTGF